MENTLGTRLKALREKLNLSQKEMAKIMGVSLRVYQYYEKDEQKPSYEKLAKLSTLRVDMNWLLTGEGEMFLAPREKTSIEEQIIQTIAHEPEEKKKALLEFLKNTWASAPQSKSEKVSHEKQKSGKIF